MLIYSREELLLCQFNVFPKHPVLAAVSWKVLCWMGLSDLGKDLIVITGL